MTLRHTPMAFLFPSFPGIARWQVARWVCRALLFRHLQSTTCFMLNCTSTNRITFRRAEVRHEPASC